MKLQLYKKILISSFFVIIFFPTVINGENIETSSIHVDEHRFIIYQLDDLKTFEVQELFYINNTRNATFNDSISIWIQNNSIISTHLCNHTLNMACRYNATGDGECFKLDKLNNTNLYSGNPITSENSLSYYGQKEKLSITAFSITDPYLEKSTIHLNATIGGKSILRKQNSFHDNGIHITSKNQDIGMQPITDIDTPYRIMTIENLTIFNNGTNTEVISFAISGLPQDWVAEIWNDTVKLDNISLFPQEFTNLNLIITAPSYIASIYIRYITQINLDGDEMKDIFIKQYLYETDLVKYNFYIISNYRVDFSKDLKMVHDEFIWREEYRRYWNYATNNGVQPNYYTRISVNLVKADNNQLNPYYVLLLCFIVFLLIAILLLRKIGFFKEKANFQEKSLKELQEQKKKVLSAIKRVEKEYDIRTTTRKLLDLISEA